MISKRSLITGVILLLLGCARQTTPEGGPKDLAPPKLVRSSPADNQKNFHDKTLTLTFTEPVKLKDPKDEIIIAPKPGKDVIFLAKQNRITIESKNGWKDSTTYSIAFRDGIQDITEGNSAENLRLAFSTGPVIDSLSFHGRISDALTEKVPEKITVAIYQSDTFNISKHAPEYFTKTDKKGRFLISNLKQGTYRLYAFDDKNKNLKLEPRSEKFGFLPGRVNPEEQTDSLYLSLISLDTRPIRLTSVRHAEKSSSAQFNKYLSSYTVQVPRKNILNTFGDDQTEVQFHHYLPPADSLPVTFHGTDSLEQTIDTVFYIKAGTTATVSEPFGTTLLLPMINPETATFTATVTFTKPLLKIAFDSIFMRIDSTTVLPFDSSEFKYDTAFKKIDIKKEIDRKILNSLVAPMEFFMSKNSLISIENDSSKVLTKKLTVSKPEDTATLLVEIQTTKTDYVIELLSTDYKVIQTVRNLKKITFKNVPPAEYKIRAYIDANKNNKWDPGNINKDIPPEPTYFYKTPAGKFQFPLRANWEVGPYTVAF